MQTLFTHPNLIHAALLNVTNVKEQLSHFCVHSATYNITPSLLSNEIWCTRLRKAITEHPRVDAPHDTRVPVRNAV